MKYKAVKTAVIGCGMISDIYLTNLKNKFSIIDLVGCSDIVAEKSAKQAEKYGIRQMTNEEILTDPEIELVLNLTYASAHFEVSKAILSAGKHCYSEKMVCLTTGEAKELYDISKEKGVYFIVAPDTFLGASQQTARMILDKGLIGEPVSALVKLYRGYYMIKSDEEDAYRKYSVMCPGGGIPYDMGGYYLHQLFQMFGPVRRVSGFAKTRRQSRPYLNPRHSSFDEDFFVDTVNTVQASLEFANGLLCSFTLTSEIPTVEQVFEVAGTEGILKLGDPNNFGEKVFISRQQNETMEFPLCHPYRKDSRGIGAADLAWAIRSGKEPRLSFAFGFHALEVIEAIQSSCKTGKVISLTTDFSRPAPIQSEYYKGDCEERSLYLR